MNNYDGDDVVDLTDSFTLIDHCALSNILIDLVTDDSVIDIVTPGNSPNSRFNDTVISQSSSEITRRTQSLTRKKPHSKQNDDLKIKKTTPRSTSYQEAEINFGNCPICWDELGKNPLVSTICGHVYCLKCLERSLCIEKRCPTCRKILKGKNAYHALYLPV